MSEIFEPAEAFVGKAFLAVGNGASPEIFTRYCETTTYGEIGEKNDLVEVTTFCSDGVKQYVPGLSEGQEFTFEANFVLSNAASYAEQQQLIADVKAKITRNFPLSFGDDSPATNVYNFALPI